MESGTLPAIPAPERYPNNYAPGPGVFIRDVDGKSWTSAAVTTPPAADIRSNVRHNVHHDVSNEQPTPNSNSAAGSSSGEDPAAENELLEVANKSRELAG